MSEKNHKRHNHYHFGFFIAAAVALAFVFAFSGARAADDASGGQSRTETFKIAAMIARFIAGHWWIVPLALTPFWLIHFLYSEWRFLKHVYHILLLGIGMGFFFLYFQLDHRLFSLLSR